MKYIYLIYDKKFGNVYRASSDRKVAEAKCKELNADEYINRYKVIEVEDIAS